MGRGACLQHRNTEERKDDKDDYDRADDVDDIIHGGLLWVVAGAIAPPAGYWAAVCQ